MPFEVTSVPILHAAQAGLFRRRLALAGSENGSAGFFVSPNRDRARFAGTMLY
jgi:hypothetical protein